MSLPTMADLYDIGMDLFKESPPLNSVFTFNKPLLSPNNDIELPPSQHSLIFSGAIKKKTEHFTQENVNRQKFEGRVFHPPVNEYSINNENIFGKMFDGEIIESKLQKKRNKDKTVTHVETPEFKLGNIIHSGLAQRRQTKMM